MSGMHSAYVRPEGRGYGRYSYTWACTCGHQGAGYGRRSDADAAARKHEKQPR